MTGTAMIFWNLPIWIERNWLGVSEFMVVHGLDAEKINQVLDSYRDRSQSLLLFAWQQGWSQMNGDKSGQFGDHTPWNRFNVPRLLIRFLTLKPKNLQKQLGKKPKKYFGRAGNWVLLVSINEFGGHIILTRTPDHSHAKGVLLNSC